MKKFVGIYLLLLSHHISFAQIQRTVEKQKTDTAKKESSPDIKNDSRKEILKELDLSKEQKLKLKEINQSMKTSKEAIENNKELSDSQKKDKLKALKKEQMTKIQFILTEEQKNKFRQLSKNKWQ